MVEALIGVASGVLTIIIARTIRGQRWFYAIGLLTLPSLYASFALVVGENAVALKEMIYGIPFIVAGLVFAFANIRYSAIFVGAFWLLHGLYDLWHGQFFVNVGVPTWYPVWCGAVDIVVGAYLLLLSRQIEHANLHKA